MGVFSELKPKNSARINPFDLSCFSTYNTKAGIILPLKFWSTLPKSKYELDLKALMRTQPLATAAFAGFSINYDVVWTPNNDHYSSFNQFIAQRLNRQHTTQPDIQQIPHFQMSSFVEYILAGAILDTLLDEISPALRSIHNLSGYVCPERSLYYSEHLPDGSMCVDVIRSLDLLEYGNLLPVLKGYVSAIKGWLDSRTYTTAADKNYPYFIRFLALWNSELYDTDTQTFGSFLDGYSKWKFEFGVRGKEAINSVSSILFGDSPMDLSIVYKNIIPLGSYDLWSVMCYNKAFWQFYRNEYYDIDYVYFEHNNSNGYDRETIPYVELFNCDDVSSQLVSGMGATNYASFIRLLCMFAIKPHQYKKDMFTGLLPSTQYGSVSMAFTDTDFHKLIANSVSSVVSYDNNQLYADTASARGVKVMTGSGTTSSMSSDQFKLDPALAISVLELRKADSLQRFKERMLRAGNKTKDIFEAHGWDAPYSEKSFDVHFFGSFDGRLDLNVVASTTDTEQVNLGQLAANGVGVISGSKIRFESHDFGTLLVVAYITKDAIYDAYGVNKLHSLLEPFDFPYPELQNVSLAPVVENQVNAFRKRSGDSKSTSVLGYLPQNMAFKTANDLVHGEFYSVDPFEDAVVGGIKIDLSIPSGIFSNMVSPRVDINDPKSLQFFYIQPNCADNIFVTNAGLAQDSDQFFANVRFDLKCTQPLDVIGLPI